MQDKWQLEPILSGLVSGDDTVNEVQNRLNIFSDDADGQANPQTMSSVINMLDENNSFGA
jgi:hypothetical protein